jgi:hypothetical protein
MSSHSLGMNPNSAKGCLRFCVFFILLFFTTDDIRGSCVLNQHGVCFRVLLCVPPLVCVENIVAETRSSHSIIYLNIHKQS